MEMGNIPTSDDKKKLD